MKFPVRTKIIKSSKIILSPLRFVIHRLGIHDHHYIMPNLVQRFREMHDPNKAHREASNHFPIMRCVGEKEKKEFTRTFRAPKGSTWNDVLGSERARSSWRVRRAEAMTAFLGGLSGTRLPALSYLFPPTSPYRYPLHLSLPPLRGAHFPPPRSNRPPLDTLSR